MKKFTIICVIFCLAVLGMASANYSIGKKPVFVVSANWLSDHIDDKDLVLLHIGKKEDFEKEHIPGAQYISTSDISTTRKENPLILELPPVERLKEKFESYGISNKSRVVLYWGKDWITPTTRVFFTLDYLGLADNVSILDGGMPAWSADGNSITAEIKEPSKGILNVKTRALVAKQAELVDALLNNKPITIIDARASKYYTGESKGSMPRGGRIPNAQNIPYTRFVTKDNKFKSAKELKKLFDDAGVVKKDSLVTYCHIGQQASLAYFAARILGLKVRIYDGSFQEWSKSKERVVTEN
jgi:thiosulfate/3-mercaptopyruvate sulfurtransferase